MLISHSPWTRREFLRKLSITGGAGLLGLRPDTAAAEPPPETTTIRLVYDSEISALCYAPQYIAEEFLRMEGFTDIRYAPYEPEGGEPQVLAVNKADMTAALGGDWVMAIDHGKPLTVLSGLHAGCVEIFATDEVNALRDLKGKRVAMVSADLSTSNGVLMAAVLAYIGVDPKRDIEWVTSKPKDWARMLAEGEVDAISTFPPMSYDVHAKKIGHVILDTALDDPWRHYFCCMVGARSEFVQNYPIATKRALRAFLKANQLCSSEPDRMARQLVDKGFASNYDYALQTLQNVRYGAWRDYDPDDTLRFFALRLHEADLIKHIPQEIIEQGTDWRFLNELKQELKA